MSRTAERAGRYVRQPSGYRAFIPSPLPPDPPVQFDPLLQTLLSRADHAVGRLDGAAQLLPNPDLFVAMYVQWESVLSSQIEGTQSTLEDLLEFQLDPTGAGSSRDVEDVVNHVAAMNYGLQRLRELPLSLRLIREIHRELMRGVRGSERTPGEFRTSQNWIGPAGASLSEATFVPPPPGDMWQALSNLESFLHTDAPSPPLVRCGLAHAQFETIHPFLDGNGRVGRLLITFLLVHEGVLHRPLLYLSHYFKRNQAEYYDRLNAVRDGDWEGWLRFFLRGVAEVAEQATSTARAIIEMREAHRRVIQESGGPATTGLRLLDVMFEHPIANPRLAQEKLGAKSFDTAANALERLVALGLLEETTGGRRNRRYRYGPYLALFAGSAEATGEGTPAQTAEAES